LWHAPLQFYAITTHVLDDVGSNSCHYTDDVTTTLKVDAMGTTHVLDDVAFNSVTNTDPLAYRTEG
jgi:hypothetical protein